MDPNLKTFGWLLTAAVVGGLVSYLFSRLGKQRDKRTSEADRELQEAKEKVKTRDEEFLQLRKEMDLLKAESVPIQVAFLSMLQAKLRHFHTPVLDALLDKIGPPIVISEEEIVQLETALRERTEELQNEMDEEELISAEILPSALKLTIFLEKHQEEEKTDLVLVNKPETVGEPEEETK